jgi:hypothetical protein
MKTFAYRRRLSLLSVNRRLGLEVQRIVVTKPAFKKVIRKPPEVRKTSPRGFLSLQAVDLFLFLGQPVKERRDPLGHNLPLVY